MKQKRHQRHDDRVSCPFCKADLYPLEGSDPFEYFCNNTMRHAVMWFNERVEWVKAAFTIKANSNMYVLLWWKDAKTHETEFRLRHRIEFEVNPPTILLMSHNISLASSPQEAERLLQRLLNNLAFT